MISPVIPKNDAAPKKCVRHKFYVLFPRRIKFVGMSGLYNVRFEKVLRRYSNEQRLWLWSPLGSKIVGTRP